MDLRQLFTSQTWWGKLIGAFFGFLVAGPTGAFFGIFVGNFFDRGLALHFSNPFWHYQSEKNTAIQRVFFEALFSTLGHMAKADGLVSQQAIHYASDIMTQMALNPKQKKTAQAWFHQGKSAQFNLALTLNTLYKTIQNKPTLIHLFVETLYQSIKKTDLSDKKIILMNTILTQLQLAPLYQNQQFFHDFPWASTSQQSRPHAHYRQQSYQQQPPPTHQPRGDDPYTLLKITPAATQADVKRAYRRQISYYHPDKLIAKGATTSAIKVATEKTQQIRKAYESICAKRGW